MHRAQVHRSHVLLVGIEDHVPGHAFVVDDIGQCVVNAGAIEAGLADGIKQRVHRVIGQRGKLLRLLVKAIFEPAVEIKPFWIFAGRIVGEDRLKTLGGVSCLCQQRGPQRAIRAEDALLHPRGPQLLQDQGCLRLVGPQHDGVGPRGTNHLQLLRKIRIAGQILLLDHHRVPQSARGISELGNAKPSVAVVHPQKRHAFQSQFGKDPPRQCQALHPVVLQVGEVPWDVGFRNGGIGGSRVDDRNLGAQGHAQRDVR